MNSTISIFIRDFQEDDFEAISALWEMTGLGYKARGDNLQTIIKTIDKGGKLLVMMCNVTGKLIGTSWITTDGRRSYIHHFGVHPDYQGKGLANKLLSESLIYVKQLGLQVKIEVHKTLNKAIRLYKKFGFSYLGDYDVYIVRDLDKISV